MTGAVAGRSALAVALVVTALILQLTVLSRLPLPLGGTPDLLLLVVTSFGLLRGQVTGMVVGFGAGLLLDLVPPSDSPAGLWALVFCVVGFLAGSLADEVDRSAFAPLVLVAGLTVVEVIGFAGLSALLGSPRITWVDLAGTTASAAAYTVVLAPFVLPLIARLAARVEPDEARW